MIPMKITPEVYAHHFPPAPEYLLLQRMMVKTEKIGSIHTTKNYQEASQRFITMGKILAVSDLPSADSFVEEMKSFFRKSGYVGFAPHVAAEVVLLPIFYFDEGVELCLIHAKDGVQLPRDVEELFSKHASFEKEQEEINEKAKNAIEEERVRIIESQDMRGMARAGTLAISTDIEPE